jgi:hypothetical protein
VDVVHGAEQKTLDLLWRKWLDVMDVYSSGNHICQLTLGIYIYNMMIK